MKNCTTHHKETFIKVRELLSQNLTLKKISDISGVTIKTIRKWRDDKIIISPEENEEQLINQWKFGIIKGGDKKLSQFVVRYIWEKYESKCSKCQWCKQNPFTNKTHLEIDHIDGNKNNNTEQNLVLLCANCHSLTPTFRHLNNKNIKTSEETISALKEAHQLLLSGYSFNKACEISKTNYNALQEYLIGKDEKVTKKFNLMIEKWKAGNHPGGNIGQRGGYNFRVHPFIRFYLLNANDNKCSICHWSEINQFSKRIKLEIDHINGNQQDHSIGNLKVLCHNCHSLTSTFQNLNVKSQYSVPKDKINKRKTELEDIKNKKEKHQKEILSYKKLGIPFPRKYYKTMHLTSEELYKLFQTHNKNLSEVARKLNCSSNSIKRRLEKAGLYKTRNQI